MYTCTCVTMLIKSYYIIVKHSTANETELVGRPVQQPAEDAASHVAGGVGLKPQFPRSSWVIQPLSSLSWHVTLAHSSQQTYHRVCAERVEETRCRWEQCFGCGCVNWWWSYFFKFYFWLTISLCSLPPSPRLSLTSPTISSPYRWRLLCGLPRYLDQVLAILHQDCHEKLNSQEEICIDDRDSAQLKTKLRPYEEIFSRYHRSFGFPPPQSLSMSLRWAGVLCFFLVPERRTDESEKAVQS